MKILLTVCKIAGITLLSLVGLLAAALLLLLLLSAFRAVLVLEYDRGDFRFRIRYLFLSFPKEGKDKKARAKKQRKKQKLGKKSEDQADSGGGTEDSGGEAGDKKSFFEKTVSGLTFFDYLEMLKLVFRKVLSKIRIETFRTDIRVGGDAYETAMTYGKINSALYPLLGLLYNAGALKEAKVNVIPDFLREKSEYYAYIELTLRPFHLLVCAFLILCYIFRKKRGK